VLVATDRPSPNGRNFRGDEARQGTSTIGRPHLLSLFINTPTQPLVCVFQQLQSYFRKDRHLHTAFSIPPQPQVKKRRPPSYPPRKPKLHFQSDDPFRMAQDMHGHSWRSRVAAHLAPVKEYLPHHGHLHIHHHHHHHHHNPPTQTECVDGDAKKHSWSHLAGRMFARRSYSDSDATTSTERVVLLPGWASRRYRAGPGLSNRTGASCRFLF
jgi:hypothetical protein